MSRIRIKNFGPIKEGFAENDGWLDIKKVTVFIGNQGSGKSTVAKLISTFMWMEKVLNRGDYKEIDFTKPNRFRKRLGYHKLENYGKILMKIPTGNETKRTNIIFQPEIEYDGDGYYFMYSGSTGLVAKRKPENDYALPQIIYVPAERNYTADVRDVKKLKLTSGAMVEFVSDFTTALEELNGHLLLPFDNVRVEYNKQYQTVYIAGGEGLNSYKIKLSESSSGFQSIVPLFVVCQYFANSVKKSSEDAQQKMSSEETQRFKKGVEEIWRNDTLTDEQRRVALSALSSRFNKTAFINIVEEPEQNLFPTSQREMLNSLLGFNNMSPDNKLIMTTHSPYLINYLTLTIEGGNLLKKIKEAGKSENFNEMVNRIVPKDSAVNGDDVAIYEMDGKAGTISLLGNYKGVPSDENKLNNALGEGNELFAELLEIEQQI